MMQTVMALLIFFIVISVGVVIFVSSQKSGFREKERELERISMLKKSKILSFLPELQCSKGNVINQNCYDVLKLNAFEDVIADNMFYYKSMFGNTNITIKRFNPEPGENSWATGGKYGSSGNWEIFDNKKENYKSMRMIQMPISLYDAAHERYDFGVIMIGIYI